MPDEILPVDKKGKEMQPIATLFLKAFPLVPKLVENDYPVWDDADFPAELFEENYEYQRGNLGIGHIQKKNVQMSK